MVRLREIVSTPAPRRRAPPRRRPTMRVQPRMVPVKTVSRTPRSNSNNFDLNKVFTDISSTFTRALSNPLVLCTVAIAIGVILTHDFEKKTGYIYELFKDHNDSISKWIVDHGKKFAGLLIFAPAVVDSPRNLRAVVALVSFLWVMIIPESKAAEYFLQSLALHTYFRLNNNNSKLMVLFIVVIAWFMGFINIGKKSWLPAAEASKTFDDYLSEKIFIAETQLPIHSTPTPLPLITIAPTQPTTSTQISVGGTSTRPSVPPPKKPKPSTYPVLPYIDCGCMEPNQCGPPFGIPSNDPRNSADYPRIYSPNCSWPRGKPQDTYIRPPDQRPRSDQTRNRNL